MGGAQPLAVTLNGGVCLVVDVDPHRLHRRVEHALPRRGRRRPRRRASRRVLAAQGASGARCRSGWWATAPSAARAAAPGRRRRRRHRPDLGARPAVATCRGRRARRLARATPSAKPEEFTDRARASMARHVEAMVGFLDAGAEVFDYGNSIRDEARQGGYERAFAFPGFVPAYIRPLFCEGKGPFRWAALSGDPARHRRDRPAPSSTCSRTTTTCTAGSAAAQERVAFQGLPARICWLGLRRARPRRPAVQRDGRVGRAAAPRSSSAATTSTAGSVASPVPGDRGDARRLRRDRRLAAAERPGQHASSGATWVSIHHGGGVGHRPVASTPARSPSPTAPRWPRSKLERVLTNDPAMGVIRHVDAGYDLAADVARERGVRVPMARGMSCSAPDVGDDLAADRPAGRLAPAGYRAVRVDRPEDAELREWFRGEAAGGADMTVDRPTATATCGPGGATRTRRRRGWSPAATSTRCRTAARYDGPLGVVSRFAAVDLLRDAAGSTPAGPIGVVVFADEEGARFGVACARLPAAHRRARPGPGARADRRRRASRWPRRWPRPGSTPTRSAGTTRRSPHRYVRRAARRAGPRPGRAAAPVGVASADLAARPLAAGPHRAGQPRRHHPAGRPATTRCSPSRARVLAARTAAGRHGALRHRRQGAGRAERRQRDPVAGHRLAGRPRRRRARRPRASVARASAGARAGPTPVEESWTPATAFDAGLRDRLAALLGATRRCCRPGPATTPGSCRRPGSRPRCCSCATRPASRTPRRARRAEPTAWPGSTRWPRVAARRSPRDDATGASTRWLGGRAPATGVRVEVDDGRIHRGRAPSAGRPRRRPAGRPRRCPASRTRTATPSTGRCAGAPSDERRHVLDLARADVRRRRPARPGQLPRAGPGRRTREMALAGITCVGEFHYLHHGPAARRTTTRTRWAQALSQAAARRRDPDHAARHLLPRRRPRGDGHRRSTASSCGSPTATPTPGPTGWRSCPSAPGAADRRRRPLGARGARATSCRRSARPPATGPLHVHLSEQLAENDAVPGASTAAPRPSCSPSAGCSARAPPPCTPPTSPTTTSPLLGEAGTHGLLLPDHRARPRRRHRPGRRLHDAGARSRLGTDSHAVIDLFEEMRGARAATSGWPPGERGHFTPAELLDAAHRGRPPRLGWPTPAGSRSARRADLVAVGTGQRRAPPARAPRARPLCSRRRPPTCTRSSSTARVVVADGPAPCSATLGPATGRRRSTALWETR